MNKILFLLFIPLVGCAHGVVDPIVETEVESNVSIPPRPYPYPTEEEATEPNLDGKDCWVAQTVNADNCVLKVIKCSDGTIDVDSYCYGPPYVPPWEWIPDPPVPQNESNSNE